MAGDALFEAAFPFQTDIMTLPVADLTTEIDWHIRAFAMRETARETGDTPHVVLERDGVQIGFAVNGQDPEQDGAAILVRDIHAARAELEGRDIEVSNWRVDERDGKKLQVFFTRSPGGLCYYFHQPI